LHGIFPEHNRVILTVMRQARTRPKLIYAHLRTGLIVIEDNLTLLSDEDRDAWNGAIAEYKTPCRRNDRKAAHTQPNEETHKSIRSSNRWR